MFRIRQIVSIAALAVVPLALHAASLEPFHATCRIRAGEKAGKLRLEMEYGDCQDHKHCGTNDNDIAATRFTGVSVASLAQSGSQLAASLTGEAGNLHLHGTSLQASSRETQSSRRIQLSFPRWRRWVSPATTLTT